MYLTGHTTGAEGEAYAQMRLEEHRAGMDVTTFDSSVRSAAVGYKFKFVDFPSEHFTDKTIKSSGSNNFTKSITIVIH